MKYFHGVLDKRRKRSGWKESDKITAKLKIDDNVNSLSTLICLLNIETLRVSMFKVHRTTSTAKLLSLEELFVAHIIRSLQELLNPSHT